MQSIAGSIVVLSGALLLSVTMHVEEHRFPKNLLSLLGVALMLAGLVRVFRADRPADPA